MHKTRWGEGTEFRMVRQEQYKYVQFRNAPPLFFDLANDPDEQHNLYPQPTSEASTMLAHLEQVVDESMDFEAAAQERETKCATLAAQYSLDIEKPHGNQYMMPSGKLVDGDAMLYDPVVLTDDPTTFFGDWPE